MSYILNHCFGSDFLFLEFINLFGNFSDVSTNEMRKYTVLKHSIEEYLKIFRRHQSLSPDCFSLAYDYVLCKLKVSPDFLTNGHKLNGKQCTYFDPITVNVNVLPVFENYAVENQIMKRVLKCMSDGELSKVVENP